MAVTLTIRDEELTGRTANELTVDFLTEHITVRELIRGRIYQEVSDHNAKPHPTEFRGLIQPSDAQTAPGGYRGNHRHPIDWKQQFEKAVAAFEQRQILILVNGRQHEALEDAIELRPDTTVTFLRLTLLVGG